MFAHAPRLILSRMLEDAQASLEAQVAEDLRQEGTCLAALRAAGLRLPLPHGRCATGA